jgi:hypothetical protein
MRSLKNSYNCEYLSSKFGYIRLNRWYIIIQDDGLDTIWLLYLTNIDDTYIKHGGCFEVNSDLSIVEKFGKGTWGSIGLIKNIERYPTNRLPNHIISQSS